MNNFFASISPDHLLRFWTSFSLINILLVGFCLINIMRSRFKGIGVKFGWIIIVVIFPVFGSLIYLLKGSATKVDQIRLYL